MIRLQRNVPLARQTTCGIGGPARFFVEAGSSAELVEAVAWARAQRLPVSVLGRGSNLLVGDGGVEGLVVRSTRRTDVEVLEDGRLRAESGASVDRMIAVALAHGLSGLEHFAGIPSPSAVRCGRTSTSSLRTGSGRSSSAT